MLTFACIECQAEIRVKAEFAGRLGKCPKCGKRVRVPEFSAEGATRVDAQASSDPTTLGAQAPESAPASASPRIETPDLTFLRAAKSPNELGRLGVYRIFKVLGQGGMGLVFKAEDVNLQRPVALKVMLPKLAGDTSNVQRFLREARSAAKLEHENIVPIYQVGQDQGVPFLAMKYLEGEPLDARLQRERVLSVEVALRILHEIALGLAVAHEQRLVHRDIKPANIWLEFKNPAGESTTVEVADKFKVRILDFGLARPITENVRVTQPGTVLGTPAYMSPEQAAGSELDARSDLFSLGCVAYHVLTGELPFRGSNILAVFQALAVHQPPRIDSLSSAVSAPLADLVQDLLKKNPTLRPQSAAEVAQRLASLSKAQESTAPTQVLNVAAKNPEPERAPLSATVQIDKPTDDEPTEEPPSPKRGKKVKKKKHKQPAKSNWWLGLGAGLVAILILGVAGFLLLRKPDRATVLVKVDQADSEVFVDEKKFSTNREFAVEPGPHELKVTKANYTPYTKKFESKPGSNQTFDVTMVRTVASNLPDLREIKPPLPPPPHPTYPEPKPEPKPDPNQDVKPEPKPISAIKSTIVLLAPAEDARIYPGPPNEPPEPISFAWERIEGATNYQLSLTFSGQAQPALEEMNLSNNAFTYRGELFRLNAPRSGGGTWRVRALVKEQWTEWSERRFVIPPPPDKPPEKPEKPLKPKPKPGTGKS